MYIFAAQTLQIRSDRTQRHIFTLACNWLFFFENASAHSLHSIIPLLVYQESMVLSDCGFNMSSWLDVHIRHLPWGENRQEHVAVCTFGWVTHQWNPAKRGSGEIMHQRMAAIVFLLT